MPRPRRFLSLGIIAFATTASIAFAQQCHDCDCYHLPMPDSCIDCCKVVTGTISAVANNTITVRQNTSTSEKEDTLTITPTTKKNAEPKEGAPATVYFRRKDKVATQINMLDVLEGLLVPGNEPDPPIPCRIPDSALKVYLGSNISWTTSDQANVLTMRGDTVLSIRRVKNGLAVFAKVLSDDGRIIAEIVDNRFYINSNNFLRMEHPDSHSLAVYDRKGNKVLGVEFLNPRSVRVLGEFRVPGSAPVIITPEQLNTARGLMERNCLRGAISILD
jgi:hypothetical protein